MGTCGITVLRDGHLEPCGKAAVGTKEFGTYVKQPERIVEALPGINVRTWKENEVVPLKLPCCKEHL